MQPVNKKDLLINDLQRHTATLLPEIEQAIRQVLQRGRFIEGVEVEAFEHEFAAFCGARHCVGVANGTDALEIALRALGVGPGGQVAAVANAGGFSGTAIRNAGAEPLYVDVDVQTLTMDAQQLRQRITEKTRAIIVTHLYGKMAAMPEILRVAQKMSIPVIEDCAQAHGAVLDGKKAGRWGALGCFSFYPTKNLGALGDGGAIISDDEQLADKIRLLKNYGLKSGKILYEGGRNSRLDEVQAAVLRLKLPHVDRWNEQRRHIAKTYTQAFDKLGLLCSKVYEEDHAAHLYVLRLPQRDLWRAFLAARSIQTQIHYLIPDHLQPAVKTLSYSKVSLPLTEACCKTVLSLPCFPEMTKDEIQHVVSSVQDAVRSIK